jgi:tyrosinase
MASLDRRTFLKVVGAIPFAVWMEREALAQTGTLVRYNVLSTEGQAMLKIYADGVSRMKALFESDPLSWTFQWYIHAVRGDRTKTTELNRIYPVPGPERVLASTVWSTCQAHFNSANRPFFLPWHRMYLLRFERIIRKLTNQPTFTLPYWNYSASGSTHGILPAAFRVSSSPLFVSNRNSSVNAGIPIDASSPGALSTTALSQCSYYPQGAVSGFCQALDSGLHGNVHVLIGDRNNMGSVPWAARDPIFWLHHSNIDRLWASWNRGGRSNPTNTEFLNRTFTFADENGQQVVGKVSEVLSILKLGYHYSAYASVPTCLQPSSTIQADTLQAQSSRQATRVLADAPPVPLASDPVGVKLKKTEAPDAEAREPFDMRVRKLAPSTRVYLVISKLQAAAEPGVLYEVYLAPSEEALGRPSAKYRVGTINFFDAVSHGEEVHANDDDFVSFDVTNLIRRQQLEGRLKTEPAVIMVPAGEPAADAKPIVGSIQVIAQ